MLMGLVLVIAAFALVVAVWLASWVMKKDRGTEAMQAISNAIQEGAEAFLARQNKTIALLAVALAALIFVLYAVGRTSHPQDPVQNPVALAFWITLSFVLGAACSMIAGYIGMWVSIRAKIRTASAARHALNTHTP